MKTTTFITRIFARLATLAAVAALALPAPAFAQFAEKESGFYAAVEIGQLTLNDVDCSGGGTRRVVSCEDSGIAWGGDVGYRFNGYFAAEAGFRFASGYKYSADSIVQPQGGNLSFESDVTHFMFGGRASYPVTDEFFVFGKAGLHFWEEEESGNGFDGNNFSDSWDGDDIYFGAGVGYLYAKKIEARLGFTRFAYNGSGGDHDTDADLIAASAAYRF